MRGFTFGSGLRSLNNRWAWPLTAARTALDAALARLPNGWILAAKLDHLSSPRVNGIDFGDLRRLSPVSRLYGWDRGTPIDRHYIEQFLESHRDAIRGDVLEISENTYTRKFGGDRVTKSDVLHYDDPSPPATVVGDLTNAPQLPSQGFDCVIITQTLMLIYDFNAAVETLHRILKPGGTVIATMPGLTQIADPPWRKTWHWGFTQSSGQRMFEDVFGVGKVDCQSFGNVLASTSFLQGLAAEELTSRELDFNDPDYQMLIGVVATKPPAANAG
jgi:hypothetical protein